MTKKAATAPQAGRRRSGRHATSPEAQDGDDATASVAGTRTSGRHTNTVAATPIPNDGKADEAPKSAPTRGRGRTSTPAAGTSGGQAPPKAATTGGRGRTRSRLGPGSEEGRSYGGRGLRKRASVSFKEASDREDDKGESDGDQSDVEMKASVVEIVDDTIYEVPKDAVVPPDSILPLGVDGSAGQVIIPSVATGHLAAA